MQRSTASTNIPFASNCFKVMPSTYLVTLSMFSMMSSSPRWAFSAYPETELALTLSCGCADVDVEAEAANAFDEFVGFAGRIAAGEVVGAEVLIAGAVS